MKPEDLKKIAEYMGYTINKNTDPELPWVYIEPENCRPNNYELIPYSPLANNNQLLEIIERLIRAGYEPFEDDGQIFFKGLTHAETLAEAACCSILEIIK